MTKQFAPTSAHSPDGGDDKWSVLIESFGNGTWEWHIDTGTVSFSGKWLDTLGYTPDELSSNEQWRSFVHPDDLPHIDIDVARAVAEPGYLFDCEFRMRAKSGLWLWARSRARVLPHNAADGSRVMLGFYEDISARKAAENALQVAERRWSYALEGAGDGVWDWNIVTGEVYFSRQWKLMLGFSGDEISNDIEEWRRRCNAEDLARSDAEIARLLSGEIEDYRCECRVQCKDGTVRWILDRGMVVERNSAGEALRMIGTHQDINEQKVAEEKLDLQARDLARRNQDLEEFAYVTSHDLQEPLRKIQSYSDRLARRFADVLPATAKADLDKVLSAALRMRALIDAMLDLARVPFAQVDAQPVDLNAVTRAAEQVLELEIAEKAATLEVGSLPVVAGNEVLLGQLIQNLLGNALKFSRAGSAPRIRVQADTLPVDQALGRRIRISVSDNGIGIDPQHAERIFKPLQRLHSREEYAGTGIGLAICRKIVAAHGGEIGVESAAGDGATFHFDLPLAD